MNDEKKINARWWQSGALLFLKLSGWIAGPVILAVFIGKFLDNIFHSSPWLSLLAIGITFIFSMVKIVQLGLNEMEKK